MTFSLLCAAAVMGAAPVQTPATTKAALPPIPQAVRTLEIVEANGAYSIKAMPPMTLETADPKARTLSIRVGNAVRFDETLFKFGMGVDHASDH